MMARSIVSIVIALHGGFRNKRVLLKKAERQYCDQL